MKDDIYLATFSEDAINVIKKNKLGMESNHLCISRRLDNRESAVLAIKTDIKKSETNSVIIHGPFTELCPASIDPKAVELAYERLNQAYSICSELKVNKMVVHSGYMPQLYHKDWHMEKSVVFWKQFMMGKPSDFIIYIENVFEDEPYMMKELIEKLDDPRIRICLDIGHANVMTQNVSVEKWIEVLKNHIGHLHIHNNDGKTDLHNAITDGIIDMEKILKDIKENCHSDITMTIESRECKESLSWLEKNLTNILHAKI